MPASVYLWCPAYPLRSLEQVTAASESAQRFATAIGASLSLDAQFLDLGAVGVWPPVNLRTPSLLAALEHEYLLAARGGYGCLDLLNHLPSATPLPYLIGYSDVTVLHAAWRVLGATESLYGFMPGVPHGERALTTAIQCVQGFGLSCEQLNYPTVTVAHEGSGTGPLFAACLSVLVGLVGTRWMPNLRGCVLALEDIDERPYRLDRALWQLHASGSLDGIVGLITNAFPATNPADYAGPTANVVMSTWAKRLGIPAIVGFPFGHHPDPLSLPCGRSCQLQAHESNWSVSIASRVLNSTAHS
jgi:muramoyltetrapeptide carboxypeptidase